MGVIDFVALNIFISGQYTTVMLVVAGAVVLSGGKAECGVQYNVIAMF